MISIWQKPEWMQQPDYLERLAYIISKSTQLEDISIDNCDRDGIMIKQIIAGLSASIRAIRLIQLRGVNWSETETIEELVKMIANAPKLERCDIAGQINSPRVKFERQKAENGASGFVKAIW